ncbi:MAG: hypothetical protein MUD10_00805 [Candidatus Pacebacteria bacterium]|jgi:hypothetical protein|nr:hypothetical protein [Candidatus Paceibacterota bacterium]
MKLFGWGEKNGESKETVETKSGNVEKSGQSWTVRLSRLCGLGKEAGAARKEAVMKNTEDGDPLRDEAREICARSEAQVDNVVAGAKKEIYLLEEGPAATMPKKDKTFLAAKNMKARRQVEPMAGASNERDDKSPKRKKPNATDRKKEKISVVEGIRRMDEFIDGKTAELRQKEGIPVDSDWRIDRNEYLKDGLVSGEEFRRHTDEITKYEKIFAQKDQERGLDKKNIDFGEVMERFCTALFYKFFQKDYIVVRTDRLGDIRGIDTFLMNRKTGDIIGAFDAVTGINKEQSIQRKKSKTFKENCKGNGKLVYGLGVDSNGEIVKKRRDTENDRLPVLCLGLSVQELSEYLQKIDFSDEKISALEIEIMEGFLDDIKGQLLDTDIVRSQEERQALDKAYGVLSAKIDT